MSARRGMSLRAFSSRDRTPCQRRANSTAVRRSRCLGGKALRRMLFANMVPKITQYRLVYCVCTVCALAVAKERLT